ncbi:MAG: hypothetical protein JWN70_6145 [Planctomycetaceae bacterium]|nr:hypothetical protein [Planctomycetaceae bacterium]
MGLLRETIPCFLAISGFGLEKKLKRSPSGLSSRNRDLTSLGCARSHLTSAERRREELQLRALLLQLSSETFNVEDAPSRADDGESSIEIKDGIPCELMRVIPDRLG